MGSSRSDIHRLPLSPLHHHYPTVAPGRSAVPRDREPATRDSYIERGLATAAYNEDNLPNGIEDDVGGPWTAVVEGFQSGAGLLAEGRVWQLELHGSPERAAWGLETRIPLLCMERQSERRKTG